MRLMLLFAFLSVSLFAKSQSQWSLGPEIQVYPTGILPGLRLEKKINEKSNINFRVAAQLIDHRDLGVQDDETGNGFGFSIGYQRHFKSRDKGLALNIRTDVWWNTIDWENMNPSESGETKITVLQPTAVLAYGLPLSVNTTLYPSLGFGWEWNVKTDGKETGQGAILLVGAYLSFGL